MKAFRVLLLLLLLFVLGLSAARAEDYVRLKNGQTIQCAILRQDTVAVYTTNWETRGLMQPPLQVYTRDEVESIWFQKPQLGTLRAAPYTPHPSGLQGGGGFSLQSWAETDLTRRYLGVLTLQGGLTITKIFGLEGEADFTFPFGARGDTTWRSYRTGYQVIVNAVAHPLVWHGLVPFAVAGGGGALGVPLENVILTRSNDFRTVVDFGLGVKWGAGGLGYAVEWRHHYYIWTPEEVINGVRSAEHAADASVIRATLFVYR